MTKKEEEKEEKEEKKRPNFLFSRTGKDTVE